MRRVMLQREAVPQMIRILIADDMALLRSGLSCLLRSTPEFDVVGEAEDGFDAVEKAEALVPDVILMDVSMPKLNGIEATRRIAATHPHIRIIGLSMHDEGYMAKAMDDAGACGYVCKGTSHETLVAAIRASSG